MFAAPAATQSSPAKDQVGFTLPAQSSEFKDSLDEFQRMVKHEQWDQAFKALEAIGAKSSAGFVDRGDGVLVPGRLLLRGLLAGLPASGKSAYRVFYDTQATALWEKAQDAAEADNLTALVNNHLISSVGDRAADRLGDLYFERGDFEQAIASWRAILTSCPDTKLSPAQLHIKLATALVRANRWSEFRQVEQAVKEKYSSEVVQIAGRRMSAAQAIDALATRAQSAPLAASTGQDLPNDLELPSENEPLWQFKFQPKEDLLNPNQPFALTDVYGRPRANDFAIASAADETRVYVNLFGVEMAFDIATGKLLWRNSKLHSLNLQNIRQQAMPERYRMSVRGERTYSVGRDPQQANQGNSVFGLIIREAATGKELFSSRRTLASWNILGEPLIVGDVAYIGAGKNNQTRELSILVLDAKDGRLQKPIALGSYAVDQNQVYNERAAEPTFLLQGERMLVDTHGGALVALEPRTGTAQWGLLYESPPPVTGYYYDFTPSPLGISSPIQAAGMVFAKGMRSARLVGVQPEGPQLRWNRPVSKAAVIIGADRERIYLGGEELAAYSLETQELLWATQLPRSAAWSKPLVTKNHIYQFTGRGVCEIDKQSGQLTRIFRGADLDSLGGVLYVTPQVLITVSNLGISAYPLKKSMPERPGETASNQ